MTRLTKLTAGLMGATALVALSAPAYAVGTAASTSVENTFSLTYDTGTDTRTITNDGVGGNDAPTAFVVDRVVNLTVTGQDSDDNAPGDTDVPVVFTVTNLGNDEQSYLLETELGDTTEFALTDGTSPIQYVVAASGTTCAATVPGTATEYLGTPATAPVVPADSVLCVYVSQNIATDAEDGEAANIDLLATTTTSGTVTPLTYGGTNDPTTVESVAIEGAPGPHSDDGTTDADGSTLDNDGADSASATYNVGAAAVTALKTVALVNESGGCPTFAATPTAAAAATELHIPGACVEYTISVTNAGSGDATDVDLTDILPKEVIFAEAIVEGGWSGTAPSATTSTGATCREDATTDCTQVAALNGVLDGVTAPATRTGTLRIRGTIRATGATN